MNRIEMVNLALTAIGTSPIKSLNDNTSEESRVMSLLYSPTVEEILSLYPWPSAIARAGLLEVEGVAEITKWDHGYRIPENCVWIVSLLDPEDFGELDLSKGSSRISPCSVPLFEREGSILFSNIEECYVKYVRFPADMENLRDIIGMAIAMRLAQYAAVQIGRDAQLSALLERRFETALLRAQIAEATDQRLDPVEVIAWGDYR